MKIQLDTSGSPEALEQLLLAFDGDDEVKSILILACDNNGFTCGNINPVLNRITKPIFGGIFPELMHQSGKLEKGSIVVGMKQETDVYTISELSNPAIDYEDILDEKTPESCDHKTMFVFVDGFAKRISALIDSLFNVFGLEINYIGGGAGSLSFIQKPVLFSNEGLIQDAAVIALSDMKSGVGVSHGWEDIAGPFKVTDSDRNIIKSIEYRPAFQVYREIIESHSKMIFSDDNFFEIAKAYPFGISKMGAEKVVRDPIAKGDDDSLICVGEVPQDVFVHILSGTNKSLINAAQQALYYAKEDFGEFSQHSATLFIDCISRVLFLGDEFNKEIQVVSEKTSPLIGALTLGEIANNGKDYLEFYNKTAVVSVLGK